MMKRFPAWVTQNLLPSIHRGNHHLEELIRQTQEIAFHPGTSAAFLSFVPLAVDRRKMT
jgi:hypothetical protein